MYKNGQWTDMIRWHFRMKMEDAELYPEVERVLTEDARDNTNSLGKRIYRATKPALVEMFATRGARKIPVNVNTIVALLNDNVFHDNRLTEIFREKDVYNDGREESVAESRHYELKPLTRHTVFQMDTPVDGSRIKEASVTPELIFERASKAIYSWIVARYGALFRNMPAEVSDYNADLLAYHVTFRYDREKLTTQMHVRHLDMEVGGRIWFSEASLSPDARGRIILKVCSGYAEPEREHFVKEQTAMFFSYPGFYKTIVDTIGVFNGIDCMNRRRILKEEQLPSLTRCIRDLDRKFPVVLIVSKKNEDGMMDEDWLGAFRVSDFTRTVWRYTHVFTCYEENGRKLLKDCGLNAEAEDAVPRLYVFWPRGRVDSYTPQDVANSTFGRHLEARGDSRTYDIVYGGQAFYHKIVTDLRDWNVHSGMWSGYEREIKTEII